MHKIPAFSVVTIVRGRRIQLLNLMSSIASSNRLPHDIHIVCMDDASDIELPRGMKNIHVHQVLSEQALPLALARNTGFEATETDRIIFVDVDCIISPTLFDSLLNILDDNTVATAYPRYLSYVPKSGNYTELYDDALVHPGRSTITALAPVNHLKFWSIVFAITKSSFNAIEGFDLSFTGYGAEDTDFAMKFNSNGMQLLFVNDVVLHQYHTKHDPPLNYFDDIVRNATIFHQKWEFYPMAAWLKKCVEMGLLRAFDDTRDLEVLRLPTQDEIEDAKSLKPY